MTDAKRRKHISELTAAEHFERIRAQRAGERWELPLTDEQVERDRAAAAKAGLPDPHPGSKPLDEMDPQELYGHINRRTTR